MQAAAVALSLSLRSVLHINRFQEKAGRSHAHTYTHTLVSAKKMLEKNPENDEGRRENSKQWNAFFSLSLSPREKGKKAFFPFPQSR